MAQGIGKHQVNHLQPTFRFRFYFKIITLFTITRTSFSNTYIASPTSQVILPPLPSLHLHHSSLYYPSVASPTPHALHLRHLVSRPCVGKGPMCVEAKISMHLVPKEPAFTVRPGRRPIQQSCFWQKRFCYNVLSFVKDTTGAHQSSRKQKCFRALFGTFQEKAICSLHVPKRARKYFCSLFVWCAPVISFTKESTFEHVLAKALLPKAALLDWSAPGLRQLKIINLTLTGKLV